MPLPAYLTSGASSRAHHALLVKLDAAKSDHEADQAIIAEIDRARALLAASPTTSRIADTLIIVLHCVSVAQCSLDVDFALVPAIELAESGRTMRERRLGYLYLAERLPRGHELHLMLVNTVRKDLASSNVSHIMVALDTIIHLPNPDLAPAAVPLLASRRLLEHKEAMIRQRTIQAIMSLIPEPSKWPWKDVLEILVARIKVELDSSVLAVVFRAYKQALDRGVREPDLQVLCAQLRDVFGVMKARTRLGPSQLVLVFVGVLRSMAHAFHDPIDILGETYLPLDKIKSRLTSIVRCAIKEDTLLARSCLLEVCSLVAAIYEIDGSSGQYVEAILQQIMSLSIPHDQPTASQASMSIHSTPTNIPPNTIIFVVRCLSLLPTVLWETSLGDSQMFSLLSNLHADDPTVRRVTLRLLRRVDHSLPEMGFNTCLEELRMIQNDNSGREHDIKVDSASERALEAVQIGSETMDDTPRGEYIVSCLKKVLEARSTDNIWHQGVATMLSMLQSGSEEYRLSFIKALASLNGKAELNDILLLTMAACEFSYQEIMPDVIDVLINALPSITSSVQEIVVVALVVLFAALPFNERAVSSPGIIEALDRVRHTAIRHVGRRCIQVALIFQRNLVDETIHIAVSHSIGDVLDAIQKVYRDATKEMPAVPIELSPSMSSLTRSELKGELRYDAYAAPMAGSTAEARGKRRQGTSPKVDNMGRSALIKRPGDNEAEGIPLDDLSISSESRSPRLLRGLRTDDTPTERTPRVEQRDHLV